MDMGIGAISGALSFPSYIYNTNRVSANSMNKVKAIPDDALASSVGYSSEKNENPLKIGQSKDLMSIIDSQMALGRMNAARIMKPAEEPEHIEEAVASNPAEKIAPVEEQAVTANVKPEVEQSEEMVNAATLQGIVA